MRNLFAEHQTAVDGHIAHTVKTRARIGGGPPGLLVAVSEFNSGNWLTGFKADAAVALLDANDKVIAVSDKHGGWADGTWIGQSSMTASWTHQFDPSIAELATGLAVYHTSKPPDWTKIFKLLQDIVDAIKQLFDAASSSSALVSTIPGGTGDTGAAGRGERKYPVYERDGDSLAISKVRSQPWVQVGLPWSQFAMATGPAPRTCVTSITPTAIRLGHATSITVHADDASTGQPVAGAVLLGNSVIGTSDSPISVTLMLRYSRHYDAAARRMELEVVPPPRLSFRAQGYLPAFPKYTIVGASAPEDVIN